MDNMFNGCSLLNKSCFNRNNLIGFTPLLENSFSEDNSNESGFNNSNYNFKEWDNIIFNIFKS